MPIHQIRQNGSRQTQQFLQLIFNAFKHLCTLWLIKKEPYINQAHQQAFSSNGSTHLLQTKTSFSTADSSKKYSSAKQFFNEMSLWTNDLKHLIAQKVPLSCPINDAINECKELYVPIQVFAHDPCPKDVPNRWPNLVQQCTFMYWRSLQQFQNLSSQPKDCP